MKINKLIHKKTFNVYFLSLFLLYLLNINTSALAQWSGSGTGTPGDPFLINNVTDLATLATNVNNGASTYTGLYFKLTANLNLNVAPYNTGSGWTPIGNATTSQQFRGNFDGDGHKITGLMISRSGTNNVGLFGYTTGTIRNLGVETASAGVTGAISVGVLIGNQNGGAVINCCVIGRVSGTNNVGGIIGNMEAASGSGSITNSYSFVLASGSSASNGVGGLAGVQRGSITNSYAFGSILSNGHGGGLVGTGSNLAVLSNSYATATINTITSPSARTGGLVGNQSQNNASLKNSVAINDSVSNSSSSSDIGRVLGFRNNAGSATNNYAWDNMPVTSNGQLKPIVPNANNIDGASQTLSNLKTHSFYSSTASWGSAIATTNNGSAVWNIWDGSSYPYLQTQSAPVHVEPVMGQPLEGEIRPDVLVDSIVVYRQTSTTLTKIGNAVFNNTNHTWSYTNTSLSIADKLAIVTYEQGKAWPSYPVLVNYPICTPLEGTYTIKADGTGDFTSLKSAADRYNSCGLTGDTRFVIASDLSETEQILFSAAAPNSMSYRLTIVSDGVAQRTVSGNVAAPLILFSSSNNITIDGGVPADSIAIDANNDNTRLAFSNLSTNSALQVFGIPTNDALNIILRNTKFSTGGLTTPCIDLSEITSPIEVSGCYLTSGNRGISAINVISALFNRNVVRNTRNAGIYYYVPDLTLPVSVQITQNNIKNINSSSGGASAYGILAYIELTTGTVLIDGNSVSGLNHSYAGANPMNMRGIWLHGAAHATVSNNTVYDLQSTANSSSYGITGELSGNSNAVFNNNNIRNVQGTTETMGIYINKTTSGAIYEVNNCTVDGVSSLSGGSSRATGIWVDGPGKLNANKITNINSINGLSAYGIITTLSSGGNFFPMVVTNNMISQVNAPNTAGININSALQQQQFFNNSIDASNNTVSGGNSRNFVLSTDASSNYQFRNNLLVNNGNTGTVTLYSTAAALQGTLVFTNNRYNTTGNHGIIAGTTYNTLASWQTITGSDTGSTDASVSFASATDLHLAEASQTDGSLVVPMIPEITFDIDGEYRDTCSNKAGADTYNTMTITRAINVPEVCASDLKTITVVISGGVAPYTYDIDFSGNFAPVDVAIPVSGGDSIRVIRTMTSGAHTFILRNQTGCQIYIPFTVTELPSPSFSTKDTVFCNSGIVNLQNNILNLQGATMNNVVFSTSPTLTPVIPNPTAYSVSASTVIYAQATGGGCSSAIHSFQLVNDNLLGNDYVSVDAYPTVTTIDILKNDLLNCCTAENSTFTIDGAMLPKHGTAIINNGKITYTPATDWLGIDSLRYILTDCEAKIDTAKLYIISMNTRSNEYFACPNVLDSLTVIPIPGVRYDWYTSQTGNTLVSGGSNTNVIHTVKTNAPVDSFWVEASSGGFVFERYLVKWNGTLTCGGQDSIDCIANGTLLFREDFGGNNPEDPRIAQTTTLPAGTTTYTFTNNPLTQMAPERYTIVKEGPDNDHTFPPAGYSSTWHNFDDHTYPNDRTRGYFMGIDAATSIGKFYTYTINELCPQTSLYFSVWVGNLIQVLGNYANPSLRFILTDTQTGEVLANYITGDIPMTSGAVWGQYGFPFTTSISTSIRLDIYNNKPIEAGNDLVLDDIEIHSCIPPVVITGRLNYCPGEALNLTVTDNNGDSLDPTQKVNWLFSTSDNIGPEAEWTVIAGQTTNHLNTVIQETGYLRAVVGSVASVDAGLYNCCSISDPVRIVLTPELMYWKKDVTDNNWNNPDNWVDSTGIALNAVPGPCTDVHIPGNADYYPLLDSIATERTDTYGDPICRDITFHFGAEVAKQHYLTYRKAYVLYNFGYYDAANTFKTDGDPYSATPMNRGRWYALAAPLKKIVSGDFSVGGFPNMWQQGFKSQPDHTSTLSGDWYTPENTAAIEIGARQNYAISVWAGEYLPNVLGENDHKNLNDLRGILQMPYFEDSLINVKHRIHTYLLPDSVSRFYYYYYDRPGLPIEYNKYDDYPRASESYRFVIEDNNKQPLRDFSFSVPAGTDIMVGNPFVSSIDFQDFYNRNSAVIENYYRLFINNNFDTYSIETGSETGLTNYIAPFQGFFLATKGTGTVDLHFPISSSVTRPGYTDHELKSAQNRMYDILRMNVESKVGKSHAALVLNSPNSSPDVQQLFIVNADSKNVPQLYLLNSMNVKNVIQYASGDSISVPVGIMSQSTDSMTFSINISEENDYQSIILEDKLLHIKTDLLENNSYIFKNQSENGERFLLQINSSGTSTDIETVNNKTFFSVFIRDNVLEVQASEKISEVELLTVQGVRIFFRKNVNDNNFIQPMQIIRGVYIVKTKLTTGEVKTQKVIY